jgi:hypothetical protein
MSNSFQSWLLLAAMLALLIATGFIAPRKLRPSFLNWFVYTVAAAILWLAYAIGAMLFDSKTGQDVPGIGYILPGFLGWILGSWTFYSRALRKEH